MTQMKCFLPALAIGCLVLLILSTAGCGVSDSGLGKLGDAAADGSSRAPDTTPAVKLDADRLSAEAGSETAPAIADAGIYDTAPATSHDAGTERVSPDGGQANPDLLLDGSRPSADTATDFDAKTAPDVPLVSDGNGDSLAPSDEPVTVSVDGSDVPTLDAAPPDSPRPDAEPTDEGPESHCGRAGAGLAHA